MMTMIPTTISADPALLRRLHEIAQQEGRSLADVVREALEWRASRASTRLGFIGSGESEGSTDTARRAGDIAFEPPPWR
jgi:predicted transcriptional regulator